MLNIHNANTLDELLVEWDRACEGGWVAAAPYAWAFGVYHRTWVSQAGRCVGGRSGQYGYAGFGIHREPASKSGREFIVSFTHINSYSRVDYHNPRYQS